MKQEVVEARVALLVIDEVRVALERMAAGQSQLSETLTVCI